MAKAKDISDRLNSSQAKKLSSMSLLDVESLDEDVRISYIDFIFGIRALYTEIIFNKYFRAFYDYIIRHTDILNQFNANFMTRKYWIINKMRELPVCPVTGFQIFTSILKHCDKWSEIATEYDIDRNDATFDVKVKWLCHVSERIRRRYLKTHCDFTKGLRKRVPQLNNEKYSDNQRLHWSYNKLDAFPKCKNTNCALMFDDPKYFRSISEGYVNYCSPSCSSGSREVQAKIQDTLVKRTGYSCALADPRKREMGKITKLLKYGDSNYSNREKAIRTFNSHTPEEKLKFRLKKEETTLRNHGVRCFMKSKQFQEQKLDYIRRNGGENNVSQIKAVREKVKATNLAKYGYEPNLASPDCIMMKKQTYEKHYGVSHNMKSAVGYKEWQASFMVNHNGVANPFCLDSTKLRCRRFYDNKRLAAIFYNQHVSPLFDPNRVKDELSLFGEQYWWQCLDCGRCFAARVQSWSDEYITTCPHCKFSDKQCNHSMFEVEVFRFLKNQFKSKRIIHGFNETNRHVILPYELDIWMPDDRVAIDCDGLFWHSIDFNRHENSALTGRMFMKTRMCEDAGINLIHVYQDEWYGDRRKVEQSICRVINKEFEFTDDTVVLPRSVYSVNTIIPNYDIVRITDPVVVDRRMPNKSRVYRLYDCGNLVFKRQPSK